MSPFKHWKRHNLTTPFRWQCLHRTIANCNYAHFIPKLGKNNSWQRFGVHIIFVLSPLSTLTASPVHSWKFVSKPGQTPWFVLMYSNFLAYPLTKAVRTEYELAHNWKRSCWHTNSSNTVAFKEVDCTHTAPATTSASPVGRAVAAYLRDAHDIPWPFVTNRFQPLIERAVSKQKNTMIGINMNLSRSSNKTCHILFALTIKPTCDSTVTKSFRSETVSGYDCAKKRMFSAKLAIPHIISFQRSVAPPTFHNPLQHCGKTTNPCLTPQIMGKLRLDRHLPRASPDWPSCSFDSIHIMWWKHALHSKE